ncbi:MAG: hypothetical protein TREMPRED_002464 [Tremellales sp. Tagirdzhanova-0007]|nr:MAG: hypothetical protein TREMPRED_002464 [Tremellales sp. Tagirdzhanova-0007]
MLYKNDTSRTNSWTTGSPVGHWEKLLKMYILAILTTLLPLIAAHGDHAGHRKRDSVPLIERSDSVSVPHSLNLTNSSISYLIPDIENKAISYLGSYVNFSYSTTQASEALQTYQELVQLFGFLPNKTVFQQISKNQDPTIFNVLSEAYCLAISGQASFESCLGYLLTLNPFFAQIIQLMDINGPDGQLFCFTFGAKCPNYVPPVPENFIPAKPATVKNVPRSGKTINVLHLSDYHLDLRYVAGSEANCTLYECCHDYGVFGDLTPIKFPAPATGAFLCDSPHELGQSTFGSIKSSVSNLSFGIFTGDLVSHDLWDLNATYVLNEELTSYNDFFKGLGPDVPVYPVLGNHDTYPHALNHGPCVDNPVLEGFIMQNYQKVAQAWANYSWIDSDVASFVQSHYGGYSVEVVDGLKIIALQTDAWYYFNYFNYINVTNPDPLGQLAMLVEELAASEAAGQKVWIIGHVASGDEDVPQGLGPATDLFYQIVDRYAPHVIANVFFGHEHTDNFAVFYANNATVKSAETAVAVSWIAQSVTPFTYLNAGWRYYEVDTGSFEIMDSHNYYANISESGTSAWSNGPVWQYEYSARATYASAIGWPDSSPLNATFWHEVSEAFLTNASLRATYNDLQVKKAPTQLGSINPSATNASLQVCAIQAASNPLC